MLSTLLCSLLLFSPASGVGDRTAAVRLLDVDGDGLLDELSFASDGSISVAVNVGNKSFLPVVQELPLVVVSDVLVSDLDDDGLRDLYLVSPQENVALLGDGTGRFREATSELGLGDGGLGRTAERLDVDGDGLTDLLLHNVGGDVLFWAAEPGHYERATPESDAIDPVAVLAEADAQVLALLLATLLERAPGPGALGGPHVPAGTSGSTSGSSRGVATTPSPNPTVFSGAGELGAVGGTPAAPFGPPVIPPALQALLDVRYVNDDDDEVDGADIADGSLTGADVSTSSGDVSHAGKVTAAQGVFGSGSVVSGVDSTVSGGFINRASNSLSTVAGGGGNVASGLYSSIGGGKSNAATGQAATVGGGSYNFANGKGSTIGGGYGYYAGYAVATNTASGKNSTIGGGTGHVASTEGTTIGGGTFNTASGDQATVGGGRLNLAYGVHATIGGGKWNTIAYIPEGNAASTIGGGTQNYASGFWSTVGGGIGNSAHFYSTTVGGGSGNTAMGGSSTVAGGDHNTAEGPWATVGGGLMNQALDPVPYVGPGSTVAGGSHNHASYGGTIGGGTYNSAINLASIGGGTNNSATNLATVPGGALNDATGTYSFAAGRRAKAEHDGAFVWGDAFNGDKTSSAPDEFNVYASGGARIFSNSAATAGVLLAPGGNSWSAVSDRDTKENVEPVDPRAVLDAVTSLRITTWNYKTQDDAVRHMGPMAQDFRSAFGLGVSDKLIDTVDPDGVALAAIQGLHDLALEQEARLEAKDAEITELRTIVEALCDDVAALRERAASGRGDL